MTSDPETSVAEATRGASLLLAALGRTGDAGPPPAAAALAELLCAACQRRPLPIHPRPALAGLDVQHGPLPFALLCGCHALPIIGALSLRYRVNRTDLPAHEVRMAVAALAVQSSSAEEVARALLDRLARSLAPDRAAIHVDAILSCAELAEPGTGRVCFELAQ